MQPKTLSALSLSATTPAAIEPCKLKLKACLGQGAYATVRLAELLPTSGSYSSPRAVAVKTLHRQLHTAEEIELFVREGELLRTLSNQ
jgi:serine/threonine protein kinase